MDSAASRRPDRFRDTLRRLVRRGARTRITRLLERLRPEDVAVLVPGLTPSEQMVLFRILRDDYPDAVGDVLTELEPPVRMALLGRLTAEEVASILEGVAVDDAVLLVESLPPELRDDVEQLIDVRDLKEVQSHLSYDDDSAGRIMDTECFALPETTSVKEAVEAIREHPDVEMIFYLYVVDEHGHLVGVTSLRQLLLARGELKLSELMQKDMIKVETDTDQEEVAQLAARYDLLAIPVTDHRNRLVGIVTVDDIVDVFKEEATEDFYKMVGTSDDELLHQDSSLRVAGIRLPWLLVNLLGLLITGLLLERFQVSYEKALFLLTFVPAIMGMGGNSGSQTSTITVRGLATGRLDVVEGGGSRRFVWQQLKVGVLLGAGTGVIVAGAAQLLQGNVVFSAVVGLALCLAIVVASLIGAVTPLIFERLGIDPAVAAGPLVTTSSDVLGILIYFGLVGLTFGLLSP